MIKKIKLFIAFFLVTVLLCFTNFNAISIYATENLDTLESPITIITCSDFQNLTSQEECKNVVEKIIGNIKKDLSVNTVDGFFCCGDYDAHTINDYNATLKGVNLLTQTVNLALSPKQTVLVKGNHDVNVPELSESGKNDAQNNAYGVFVINESDYKWLGDDEITIKNTAQNLTEYLNEKIKEKYEKPIFILSHLSLAYSQRTFNDGDGMYANYIFDVLNEASEKGLNIVYMHGHNHSNGWDDYMGGSAIYLPKGDQILIAQKSKTQFKRETLGFTYMNAGYIGYYLSDNIQTREENGLDKLSMCKIEIYKDRMAITRYNMDGICNLKEVGVRNQAKNETAYDPILTVYPSPASVKLTNVIDDLPIASVIPKTTDVNVEKYVKVKDLSEIKADKDYILVSSSEQLVLPKTVSRTNSSGTTRKGLDLSTLDNNYGDMITGLNSQAHWKFEPNNNGFHIKNNDNKYLSFKNAYDSGIAVVLENNRELFTINKLENGTFTFSGSKYVLRYSSSNQLIHGYTSGASVFFIYEYVPGSYTVNFRDYDGSLISSSQYKYGEDVIIPNSPNRERNDKFVYAFSGWNKEVDLKVTKSVTYIAKYSESVLEPSTEKVQEFADSVGEIDKEASLTKKYQMITHAVELYNNLINKERLQVENEYNQLLLFVNEYNDNICLINKKVESVFCF